MESRYNKMLIVNEHAPPRAPHSTSFTGPTPGLTGPSGFPRSPAVLSGRPHRASCPGRPRMDILSIRPLASRSARRWAKGSRSRKRRRVAPERLTGGTGMSRQARRGTTAGMQEVGQCRSDCRGCPFGPWSQRRQWRGSDFAAGEKVPPECRSACDQPRG
jgi:hypothetical protein